MFLTLGYSQIQVSQVLWFATSVSKSGYSQIQVSQVLWFATSGSNSLVYTYNTVTQVLWYATSGLPWIQHFITQVLWFATSGLLNKPYKVHSKITSAVVCNKWKPT